ncbi:hypothetical protein MP11Mi_00010 [Gordonia sp. MP11Mi]|uniref:Uncharacterized protein n=1 Tax=Gordonia sp. MP11Mi TaxID=3022769 RepID=A0AA97CTN3_9ACTN
MLLILADCSLQGYAATLRDGVRAFALRTALWYGVFDVLGE